MIYTFLVFPSVAIRSPYTVTTEFPKAKTTLSGLITQVPKGFNWWNKTLEFTAINLSQSDYDGILALIKDKNIQHLWQINMPDGKVYKTNKPTSYKVKKRKIELLNQPLVSRFVYRYEITLQVRVLE